MKVALISYHKNIYSIYPHHWVGQYRESIQRQTYQNFQIFEMNYGSGVERIFEHSYFEAHPYPTFVHAMNYLLDKCFSSGYDVVFNSNVDDMYRLHWIEKLLEDVQAGYDFVSCNFCLVRDDNIFKYHTFHTLDVYSELLRGHNPVAHPAVAYTANFWKTNRYDPDEIPLEDMLLWKRALEGGMKLFIDEQNLLFHRIHNNAVCRSQNR